MEKTREELVKDLEKYQAQLELYQGRRTLLAQEAFTFHEIQLNWAVTMIALLQGRIRTLEERMDKLMAK